MKDLTYRDLLQAAIVEGSTSPNPGTAPTIAWSTSLLRVMMWNGSTWRSIPNTPDIMQYAVSMPGKFQLPQHLSYSTGTSLTVSANTAYICPIWSGRWQTINRLGSRISTSAASTNIRVALYSDHPTLGKPHQIIADSGNMSSATTGDKEAVVSITLAPGMYWTVVTSDGTPSVGAGTINSAALGGSTSAQNIRGWTASLTFGAYPSDASGWSLTDYVSTNMPVCWIRVV